MIICSAEAKVNAYHVYQSLGLNFSLWEPHYLENIYGSDKDSFLWHWLNGKPNSLLDIYDPMKHYPLILNTYVV